MARLNELEKQAIEEDNAELLREITALKAIAESDEELLKRQAAKLEESAPAAPAAEAAAPAEEVAAEAAPVESAEAAPEAAPAAVEEPAAVEVVAEETKTEESPAEAAAEQ